jgi:Ca2+ transporting ATPase
MEKCGIDTEKYRNDSKELKKMPFNSSRKRMGVVIGLENGGNRLVEKGASELILEACSHYHSFNHGVQPI